MLEDDYTAIRAECRTANAVARRLKGGEAYVEMIRTVKQAKAAPMLRRANVTARQMEVLAYMQAFLAENDEFPPLWKISQHFGWATSTSAQCHVDALGRKGVIERNEIGNWRMVRAPAPRLHPED